MTPRDLVLHGAAIKRHAPAEAGAGGMSDVGEVRALLSAFVASPWRQLYLRSEGWTVFFAKPGGGASPLRAVGPETAAIHVVTAPHLGSFAPARAIGMGVRATDVIGTLAVLDTEEDVLAGVDGAIATLAAAGALVEYGAPLASIAP